MQRIQVIDSHTGGEPTRIIVAGGPELGHGSMEQRRERFRQQFDAYRRAVVNEPRGHDVLVGAILCEPVDSTCVAGIIFFNNTGYLNMCGHGTIGAAVTLGHLGRIGAGRHRLETPVGIVAFDYDGQHRVAVENVPSYRYATRVPVEVPGHGVVHGDIAWGGNWFFLVSDHGLELSLAQLDRLTNFTYRLRRELERQQITGANGAEIDHIELFGPPTQPGAHSKNFVLCPGLAYDRSPCGTGTSAKVACLFADGKLQPGEVWLQESIIGSVFTASFRLEADRLIPRIEGTAYITGESMLLLDSEDPFCWGIRI